MLFIPYSLIIFAELHNVVHQAVKDFIEENRVESMVQFAMWKHFTLCHVNKIDRWILHAAA